MADSLRLQTLKFQRSITFITETCHSCDAVFALDEAFHNARLADKRTFYCPNGHSLAYQGKSETQKLREQLDEERRQRQAAQQKIAEKEDEARIAWSAATQERERAAREKRRANGYKGHATRITKRAKAGVCPCCNRTFKQLAQHMASKHPTFTPMEIEDRPPEGVRVQ